MRGGIDVVATAVLGSFKLNPAITDAIFIFCNEQKNRIKILQWDGNGFWLHYKRLEHGKFPWPKESPESKTMVLSSQELEHLLGITHLKLKLDHIELTSLVVV